MPDKLVAAVFIGQQGKKRKKPGKLAQSSDSPLSETIKEANRW
jgi:hypothetical protein